MGRKAGKEEKKQSKKARCAAKLERYNAQQAEYYANLQRGCPPGYYLLTCATCGQTLQCPTSMCMLSHVVAYASATHPGALWPPHTG